MLNLILLPFAAAVSADASEPIIIVDDTPTIHLSLAGYDLGKTADVGAIELRIRRAANRVCRRQFASGSAIHLETVACVKAAVADADRQLSKLVAGQRLNGPAVASIIVPSR